MAEKKKPTITGIVALIISVLTGCILIIDILTTDAVSASNIITITGHYKTVNKLKGTRGSLYYEIFVQENQRVYRIGADDSGCFAFDRFLSEISSGQLIKISFRRKNSFFKVSDIRFVVSIEANGNNYLDPECINDHLKSNKTEIPILALGLMTIGFLVYRFKR